jgi:DNA-directed RNA polymerase subunit beta'
VDQVRWNGQLVRSTVGRVIFNDAFPRAWNEPFRNHTMDKSALKLITECYRRHGNAETAAFLDAIKALGFRYATQSGTTVSISDVVVPDAKFKISTTRRRPSTNSTSSSTRASCRKKSSTTRRFKFGRRRRKK